MAALGSTVCLHCGADDPESPRQSVTTLEGVMTASVGDFLIRGVVGEVYPCKPGVFAMTYERVCPTDAPQES